MTLLLEALLRKVPPLRRLTWRVGRRLYCAARGEPRRNDIALNGEALVQRCIARAAGPLVIFDIGANKGEWSLSMLDALAAAGVEDAALHVFEPVPETRGRLTQALAAHPLGRCAHIRALAASDSSGRAQMARMSEDGGVDTLHGDDTPPPCGFVETETVDLFTYFQRETVAHAHLVKSDAEGHDFHILRGALPLLREQRITALQFEYNHRWITARAYLRDVFALLDGLPYVVARETADGLETVPSWSPELERFFEANWIIVHEPALALFPHWRGRLDANNCWREEA